jgi:hypothetical protein
LKGSGIQKAQMKKEVYYVEMLRAAIELNKWNINNFTPPCCIAW